MITKDLLTFEDVTPETFEGSVGVRSKELGKSIGKDLIMARKI